MICHKSTNPHKQSQKDILSEWHQDCVVLTVLLASVFSAKDMKRMLEKNGYQGAAQENEGHKMLQSLHALCHSDPKMAAQIEKIMQARFGNTVLRTKKLSEAQLSREALDSPWLVPYLWACYRRPEPAFRLLGRELAHGVMLKGLRGPISPEKQNQEQERAEKLSAQVRRLSLDMSQLRKENKALHTQIHSLQSRDSHQKAASQTQKSEEQKTIKLLRAQLADQKQAAREQADQLAIWRSMALHNTPDDRQAPQMAMDADADDDCPMRARESCEGCESEELCKSQVGASLEGSKVAIIGGLERLEPQYRYVIEQMGGSCLFSAGHTKSGGKEFRSMVKKSDLVICITAINSHGAMKVVKKQCKLCRKPFCPLKGTSVGSLKSLLHEYAKDKKLPTMFEMQN